MLKVSNHLRISKLLWDEDCTKNDNFCIENLIAAVRNCEGLWKKTDKYFKNKFFRAEVWNQIAKDIDCDESAIPDIRRKWETVKASYFRSKRKLEKQPSGHRYKTYKYAEQLSFLDEYMPRSPNSQIRIASVEEAASKVFEQIGVADYTKLSSQISQDNSSDISRDIASTSSSVINKDIANKQSLEALELQNTKTSDDIFGEYIAAELKMLPEHMKDDAKLSLMKAIAEAKKK